ncbi:MAG: YDG domain-containing protein, partial [Verrucomicrobia bacterium]|nr:YDG domain-containing protein [Verrucomicrobiota bacterium]
APLTLTANPAGRAYGAANPSFSGVLSGFVNGESLLTSGISGTANVTTSATALSPVGPYAIIPATGSLTAANYAVTTFVDAILTVTRNTITVEGVTVANKIYDRTPTATPSFAAATLRGVAAGDTANVTLVTTDGTAAFADKLVGSAKPVTVSGLTLAGPSAANYVFEQPTGLTADITAKTLTVSGVTASPRTYDATTAAPLTTTAAALVGVVDGDAVTLSTTHAAGTFAAKTVGTAKPVTVTGLAISGADAGNYALTQPTGLTADVTSKNLTVAGVTAASKAYEGTTAATLGFGSATLVGIAGADTVTLATGGAAGTFANANAGSGKPVTITGLALAGPDAVNYTLSQPTATASISPASAAVAITDLNHVYDGSPKPVTVTVTPAVGATIVYSGTGGVAPANAGSYTVTATIADPNFSGGASATLVIAKASQTVAFTLTGTNFTVGSTLGLSATASSGLPVTFALESGAASLSGSSLVITAPGAATVRATQAGDSNYRPATADQSFTGVAAQKTAQTIAFAQPSNRTTGDPAFGLSATASSGLPVTFTVVGGPAVLSPGNLVTLLGNAGTVTLRASQAGDATFAAAPDVTRSFVVTGRVIADTFFGDLIDDAGLFGGAAGRGELIASSGPRPDAKSGDIAAVYYPDSRRGTVLIVAPGLSLNVSLEFALNDSNTYTVPFTSAGRSLTLTGTLNGATLTGRIPALRVGFSTQVQSRAGSTNAIAGYYQSNSVNSSGGGTSTIVGSNGQLLIVATTSTVTTGALGTVAADGTFSISAPGATITGAVDAPSTSVTGTIVVPNQTTVSFSGVAATTARTDRLINLSSRVRIAPAAGRTLITGFVIGGTESKRVLVRAVGPTLAGFDARPRCLYGANHRRQRSRRRPRRNLRRQPHAGHRFPAPRQHLHPRHRGHRRRPPHRRLRGHGQHPEARPHPRHRPHPRRLRRRGHARGSTLVGLQRLNARRPERRLVRPDPARHPTDRRHRRRPRRRRPIRRRLRPRPRRQRRRADHHPCARRLHRPGRRPRRRHRRRPRRDLRAALTERASSITRGVRLMLRAASSPP